jgi:RNA recognition motif-containing protein
MQYFNAINSNTSLPNKEASHKRPDGTAWPSLYIGNLPTTGFYDLDLKQFFTQKGFTVRAATVASDFHRTKSLGYGYIAFNTEEE